MRSICFIALSFFVLFSCASAFELQIFSDPFCGQYGGGPLLRLNNETNTFSSPDKWDQISFQVLSTSKNFDVTATITPKMYYDLSLSQDKAHRG
eukprot:TRINITY_DN622_c0_g1_i1.p1 TRINITY_DN622_c0_g1~~TRINITY_DN622_c0_g1_i1.p1  ORF type:complete len:94 (+),score=15.76 TRINITY_DN622_c0_g1_i1:60-341(+)